ncbi:MAG: hypothetical protein WCF84_04925 [Anaerolineae bacterium]
MKSYLARLGRTGHLPALALFTIITLMMTWPYPRQVETSLYNWSDALLNSWTLAWGTHALLADPANLYNANIFYPYPNALAYSESLVPQAALAMPVILLTDMPAFAHNLLALSSFVLAAFGMYLLVFDLTRSRAGGLVAGMIFSFTSYRMMHFAHLQLLSSEWMPFALLYLHRLLTPGTWRQTARSHHDAQLTVTDNHPGPPLFSGRKDARAGGASAPKAKQAVLFALFFAVQALSSFYYAFFIAIAAALYVTYVLVIGIIRNSKFRIRNSRLAGVPTGQSATGGSPHGPIPWRVSSSPSFSSPS